MKKFFGAQFTAGWIKENWFRAGILITLLSVTILGTYYLFVFVPSSQRAAEESRLNRETEQKIISGYKETCSQMEKANEKGNEDAIQFITNNCNKENDPLSCMKKSIQQSSDALAPTGQAFINECVQNMIEQYGTRPPIDWSAPPHTAN